MADALKTFREGEDILASETNDNNQFLLSKLSDNAAQVQQYVEGEVATIKSNVASVQATLQNNIDELDAKVENNIHIIEFIKDGDYWRRTYSNGWCEQGGISAIAGDSVGTVVLNKPYIDTSYHIIATLRGSFSALDDAGVGAYPSNNSSFRLENGYGARLNICWMTSGFIKV